MHHRNSFSPGILPFLLVLLLVVPPALAQDYSLYQKRQYTNADGNTLPYRVLYPKNYDRTKKYPLILFLHGAGERGNDNEKQLVHGAKLFLKDENREQFPCIVIIPQCPTDSYWSSVNIDRSTKPSTFDFDYTHPLNWPLVAAMEVVKQVLKEEGVNKKQLYIMGLSMGGMGTFEALYNFPKVFAAAAPICGGADVNAYDKRVQEIPFWVFHGDADAVVSVDNSRKIVDKLKKLNISVDYSEYPGINHNSWDNAFAEPNLLPWMFSKSRKKAAKF
jgi:predicted peptidase